VRREVIGSCALYLGDCREVLAEVRDAHACVTDPPYHIASIVKRFGAKGSAPAKSNGATGVYARQCAGFVGEQWDGGAIAFDPTTWEAVLAAMRAGGHLVSFASRKNYHRAATAIEVAGFEIRDMLVWMYAQGKPNSHNVGRLMRKAGEDDDAAREWDAWGTDAKGAHEPICLARKMLAGDTIAENVREHGTGALNIEACRGEDKRWPATVLHDGSVEVYGALPHQVREMIGVMPCMKPSKAERAFGLEAGSKGHPATKPAMLMQWLCRLVTPAGGLVLDPFMGAGTTGLACVHEGFRFIGIEKDERFFDMACRRIEAAVREFEGTIMGAVQHTEAQ
jgi:site-specific DNA-methyltransferase (adenine-specific)